MSSPGGAAALVRERTEPIARVMSTETGKPLAQARGELGDAADQFDWYAGETQRIYGHTFQARVPEVRMHVRMEPVGVVAAFSAWNFPALLPARKIAAALGAGCTLVVKPASEAAGSCMALVQALQNLPLLENAAPAAGDVQEAIRRDLEALGAEQLAAILKAFLRQSAQEVAALRESLRGGDEAAIAKRAHRLRGGAANFELSDLCAVTRRIEEGTLRGDGTIAELAAAHAGALRQVTKAAESLSLVLAPPQDVAG